MKLSSLAESLGFGRRSKPSPPTFPSSAPSPSSSPSRNRLSHVELLHLADGVSAYLLVGDTGVVRLLFPGQRYRWAGLPCTVRVATDYTFELKIDGPFPPGLVFDLDELELIK